MNLAPVLKPGSFYVTGGSLKSDALCYVPRQADEELYQAVKAGDYCYVLTPRQMGKSSLMVRTAHRLRAEGITVAVLDLTRIGQNVTAEQWYFGLLDQLGQQCRLENELEEFWAHSDRTDWQSVPRSGKTDGPSALPNLGPLQRWMHALRSVVLERCTGPLVIFIDEIDAVRSLEHFSTDEFFAAIRECYNRRTVDAEMSRLIFCLIGVATPSDLISNTRTTPFNIGRRIELNDFTLSEAARLSRGLHPQNEIASGLLRRIHHWTQGHPYLTQRLCRSAAESALASRDRVDGDPAPPDIDRLCEELFLSNRARERDDNLLFVRERVLRSEVDQAGLLDLLAQVRGGKKVKDDEFNPLVSVLRLSGMVRVCQGFLQVRNPIYERVFDPQWIQTNMPDAEKRRQRRAYRKGLFRASGVAAAVILLVLAGFGVYRHYETQLAEHEAQQAKKTTELRDRTKQTLDRSAEFVDGSKWSEAAQELKTAWGDLSAQPDLPAGDLRAAVKTRLELVHQRLDFQKFHSDALFYHTLFSGLDMPEAGKALDAYLDATKPAPPKVYRKRGLLHAQAGQPGKAILLFSAELEQNPKDTETRCHRGWAYLLSGAPLRALDDFNEILGAEKTNIDARIGRGNALIQLGQLEEALEDAQTAEKQFVLDITDAVLAGPKKADLSGQQLYYLARIYTQAADLVEANARQRIYGARNAKELRRNAFDLLWRSLDKTPAEERPAVWRSQVATDPALAGIRKSVQYSQLRKQYAPAEP